MDGSENGVIVLYAATWAAMVRDGYVRRQEWPEVWR